VQTGAAATFASAGVAARGRMRLERTVKRVIGKAKFHHTAVPALPAASSNNQAPLKGKSSTQQSL